MSKRVSALGPVLTLLLALCASTVGWASEAHQHGVAGVAGVDMAVDGGRISLQLDSPLENLLGFERAPRSDAERRRDAAAVATRPAAESLFRLDPAGGCQVAKVAKLDLVSSALNLGSRKPASPGQAKHAYMDASFEFGCQAPDKARFVGIALFDVFARLSRLELQVAAAKAQSQATLRRPAGRVLPQR